MAPTAHPRRQGIEQALFYGILDSGYVAPVDWVDKYEALARGGCGLIQIRAKKESGQERKALLEMVLERRAQLADAFPQPPLIVNDDIELCLAYPDLGLHVGQDDLHAREARQRLGPERLLGLSTHSIEQAASAIELGPNVLSYFAVGPVFPTQTKPDYHAVGLQLVAQVAQLKPRLPFFCIGGINRGNFASVRAAGASRIVTVSDVLLDADTERAVRQSIASLI